MNYGKQIRLLGRIGKNRVVIPHFHDTFRSNDVRGSFYKPWRDGVCELCESNFIPKEMFWSKSVRHTVRGFHYFKEPGILNRIVTVVEGEIQDVIFNLKESTPKFITNRLTAESKALYIPTDFAHGFEVLSDSATVLYLTDSVHKPEYDVGLNWKLFTEWVTKSPILSTRDENFPLVSE